MDAPGFREELRDMCRRIGTVGYYVIMPNMYYRIGREGHYGFDPARIRDDDAEYQKMRAAMTSLTNALVMSDTGPILQHIRADRAAAPGPVGCVGYCMSGRYVMSAGAAFPDDIAAIMSVYGVGIITDEPDSPHLKADRIKAECHLAFAAEDVHVPDEIPAALPGILAAAGVTHRVETHPGTAHGFAFPQRAVYVKDAAERHWERMFDLFGRKLKP